MLPAVTAGLPTYWLYVIMLWSMALIFFKATEEFTVVQPAAQIFTISGTVTRKDAQDLLTVILSTMSPPPQTRIH